MNGDQRAGTWKQFTGKVKEKWRRLSDDKLTAVTGRRGRLAGIGEGTSGRRGASMRVKFPESVLGAAGENPPPDGEVIELALLVPSGQLTALERAARHEGLTLGQMVRRLIHDFLARPTATLPGGEAGRPPDSSRPPDRQGQFP